MKHRIERRRFLRGALGGIGIVVGLPTLECFLNGSGTAWANGTPLPLRFGTWFWGLGWPAIGGGDTYTPSGSGGGSAWSIRPGMAPLAPHKDYLTVFTNYSYRAAEGAAHIPSRGISVSGSHNPEWVIDSGASGFRRQNMPHPSIDALVQESWGTSLGTPHSYINATLKLGTLYESTSSWNRGGAFRLFQKSPLALFNAVFAPLKTGTTTTTPTGPTPAQVTNAFRKSVLDAVSDDLRSLKATLGASDKLRLDAHLQRVTEMQARVAALGPVDAGVSPQPTNACASLTAPLAYGGANELRLRNQATADLMVHALACNLTRLFCFEFSPTQCSGTVPEIGLSSGEGVHDAYSHGDNTEMSKYCDFVLQSLAYFVNRLKTTPDGAGNLLDNTLVLATSECGPVHFHDYHPYLFIGKAGGRVKGNWHSVKSSRSNNEGARVLLTAAHAVGAMVPRLGMPATNITGASSGQTNHYEVTTPIAEVLT